jgi:hypothetical protein
MKFMGVWSVTPENWKAAIKRMKEADPKPASGVRILGRWHEVGTGKGFTLVEADDLVALSRLVAQWSDLVDQKLVPVVVDEEIVKAV